MKRDWALDYLVPCMSRLPTTLPWLMAGRAGIRRNQGEHLVQWLAARFPGIFPQATRSEHEAWARAHYLMLAQEKIDAMAFDRMGRFGGPSIDLHGLDCARALVEKGRGFILVLNHFDRLLTAPVALARHGIVTNVLTMPVLDNPELGYSQRHFLLKKIARYARETGGKWHTTADGMRPVHESLRQGGGWVILADAWRPEFGRLREHPFLGGVLSLPTGIERLAQSTGAALLHAATYSQRPDHLKVVVESLPEDPQQAINAVICRLDKDVQERPWAWWHWGLWDQMWRPATPQEERLVQH